MINWRAIVAKRNKALFRHKGRHFQIDTDSPKYLIIDDTDFEKISFMTENAGKIWSHVKHKSVLGFKGLFLGYWDGKSFFSLNFSLHKEKGKNKKKLFGLTSKEVTVQETSTKEYFWLLT